MIGLMLMPGAGIGKRSKAPAGIVKRTTDALFMTFSV